MQQAAQIGSVEVEPGLARRGGDVGAEMEVRGVELRPRRVGAGRTWSAITRKTTLGSSAPARRLRQTNG